MTSPPPVTPLVGREDLVARLWAAVEASADGGMRTVVARGPAGIGKTRVLAEFTDRARGAGTAVVAGRSPAVGGFAFGALSDALGAYVRSTVPGAAQVRRPGEALRRVVPQLTVGDDDATAETPAVLGVVQGMYRLLAQVTERRPLVLIVDDAHICDAETCEVLWSLRRQAARLPWLLVFGVRRPTDEHEPAAQRLLRDLQHDSGVDHIELQPLDRVSTGALIASLLGDGIPAPSFVDMVFRRTGGNPYYTEELVRWLRDNDRVQRHGPQWNAPAEAEQEVPPSIEEALGARIRALPESARNILVWLSAAGGSADADLLRGVSGLDVAGVEAALRHLLRAGLLSESRSSPGAYHAHHPLVVECAYAELRGDERMRAHRALALTLARRDAPPAVVARHFAESATPGDGDAIDAALRAAEEAEAQYQFGKAVNWYEQVLRLLQGESPLRARSLDRISELSALTGRWPAGINAVQQLMALQDAGDDVGRRVVLLRRLATLRATSGDLEGARAAIDEGLSLAPQSGAERPWLLYALARIAMQTLPMHEFHAIVQRGVEAAADAGPDAQHVAFMLRSFEACAVTYGGDPHRGAQMAYDFGAAAIALEDPMAAGYCVFSRTVATALMGRCEEAAQAFGAISEPAEDVGLVWEGASSWAERAEALLYCGDIDAAFESCLRAEDLARRHSAVGSLTQPVLTGALILMHRNDLDAAGERLREARSALDRVPDLLFENWYWYVRGQVSEARDDVRDAISSYERMWDGIRDGGAVAWVVYRPAQVHALIAAGRSAEALDVAEDIAAVLDGIEQPRAHAFAALATGAALIANGDATAGRQELERGLRLADTLQGRLLPAQARLLAGAAFASAGERSRTRTLLDDALQVFDAIGAVWLAGVARARLRNLGVRAVAPTLPGIASGSDDPLGALTARERETVELAARGLRSKAIALRLGISERTVENHIAGAYAKLHVHSRAGLIALVARRPIDTARAAI